MIASVMASRRLVLNYSTTKRRLLCDGGTSIGLASRSIALIIVAELWVAIDYTDFAGLASFASYFALSTWIACARTATFGVLFRDIIEVTGQHCESVALPWTGCRS